MAIETTSDRDFACFFCGQGKAKNVDDHCPNCNRPINIGPMLLNKSISNYSLRNYISRGYYGATFCAETRIKRPVALKLVPRGLYVKHDKSFQDEIEKYRELGDHPNIAELFDAGDIDIDIDGAQIAFYYIVMEWVDGITLSKFLQGNDIDASIVYGATLDLCSAISRFEAANLWHNDLNRGNVLVKRLTDAELQTRRSESPYIIKVVDTGSSVFRQSYSHRSLDDIAYIGQHINSLALAAQSSKAARTLEDEFFLDHIGPIVTRTLDESPVRRFGSARDVSQAVTKLYETRHNLALQKEPRLATPFEYLNANDFPYESFVVRLFSDKFPWVNETILPSAQSLLITGPRGSGKTMVLRSMRLKARMNAVADNEDVQSIASRIKTEQFVAFFVSARTEIGNYSLLSKLPRWMEDGGRVVLYFQLLYLYEIVDTIYFGLLKGILTPDHNEERQFLNLVGLAVGIDVVSLSGALSAIKRAQEQILTDDASLSIAPQVLTAAYLRDVCRSLELFVPIFADKRIFFLLDDFSYPKVPRSVQRTLLPIIWNTGGGYTFRVTSHSASMETVDTRGNHYLVNRDFREVNLGAEYINSCDTTDQRGVVEQCVADIFGKRVALTPIERPYTVSERLNVRGNASIAVEIRHRHENKSLRGLRYYGWDTILNLCSGDISSVIDIVGQILEGASPESPVPVDRQHSVIKQYARQELYKLQDYNLDNINFYNVAANFGKMSLFKLCGNKVKDGKLERIGEFLRIEVQLTTSDEAVVEAIGDLLRNGVFIDGGFSASSQGNLARRLIFKKIYTPVFPTTNVSRDTFPMTARHFLEFVRNPESHLRQLIARAGLSPSEQQPTIDGLFDID